VLPLLMSGFGGIGLFGGILLSLDFIVVFDLLIWWHQFSISHEKENLTLVFGDIIEQINNRLWLSICYSRSCLSDYLFKTFFHFAFLHNHRLQDEVLALLQTVLSILNPAPIPVNINWSSVVWFFLRLIVFLVAHRIFKKTLSILT